MKLILKEGIGNRITTDTNNSREKKPSHNQESSRSSITYNSNDITRDLEMASRSEEDYYDIVRKYYKTVIYDYILPIVKKVRNYPIFNAAMHTHNLDFDKVQIVINPEYEGYLLKRGLSAMAGCIWPGNPNFNKIEIIVDQALASYSYLQHSAKNKLPAYKEYIESTIAHELLHGLQFCWLVAKAKQVSQVSPTTSFKKVWNNYINYSNSVSYKSHLFEQHAFWFEKPENRTRSFDIFKVFNKDLEFCFNDYATPVPKHSCINGIK